MGRRIKIDHRTLGPDGKGPVWLREGILRTTRKPLLGKWTSVVKAQDKGYLQSLALIRDGKRTASSCHSPFSVAMLRGNNNTHLERRSLVESVRKIENRVDVLGADRRQRAEWMESQKLALAFLDRLFSGNEAPLLSPRTVDRYKRTIAKYLLWLRENEREHSVWKQVRDDMTEEEMKHCLSLAPDNIEPFLRSLSQTASGENVFYVGKVLLRTFAIETDEQNKQRLKAVLYHLRQAANTRNPPKFRAAEAVTISDLVRLVTFVENNDLPKLESQAVEVFVVAFATMSRVAEIVSLKVDSVGSEGDWVVVRGKTDAKTKIKHMKRVSNGCGLCPVDILLSRRRRAVLEGRRLIFSRESGADTELTTAQVSSALARVTKKAGIQARISAHSARKGAAVLALLNGVPIVAIQGLGLWKCVDSLQAYLGRAVRESLGVLSLIDGGAERFVRSCSRFKGLSERAN